jgi:hypothetical protein
MPEQTQARRQLATAMDNRRLELGMRWQDVAAAGGVSLRAISQARTGDKDIRPLTRRGIEKGLEWAPGTIERILSGRAAPAGITPPEPPPGAAPPSRENAALRQILEDERLPLEVRRGMVALAEAMRRRTDAERGGERGGRSALPALALAWYQVQPGRLRLRVPVGAHRGEGLAVGADARLKAGDPELGVPLLLLRRQFAGPGLPEPQCQRAPHLGHGAGQRQVPRPVRVELGPRPCHRRPQRRDHDPQDPPEDGLHPVPPPPRPAGRPAERGRRRLRAWKRAHPAGRGPGPGEFCGMRVHLPLSREVTK